MSLRISVVICAYTLQRWDQLQSAVASVCRQTSAPAEVVVVIDHNEELLAWARAAWTGTADGVAVRVMPNRGHRGLSGARNTGVAAASGEIVAFLDDDACADAGWLAVLSTAYRDPRVAAVGGAALATSGQPRPRWWPLEFDWVVGCSYVGLPTDTADVRNLIGANMSARRSVLVELGGFPDGIGRLGDRPVGCEETDLFIRLAQRWPEARVVYEPRATVAHHVSSTRWTWRYFRARCFAEGLSKALVAQRVGAASATAAERTYATKVLPVATGRAVVAAARAEPGAARRAGALVAGFALTGAGFAWGQLLGLLPRSR